MLDHGGFNEDGFRPTGGLRMTTRAEHVKGCKTRALEYLDQGDAHAACASMVSDMHKHDETAVMLRLAPFGGEVLVNQGADGMRKWIEGFAE
jgi:hypothetical protein